MIIRVSAAPPYMPELQNLCASTVAGFHTTIPVGSTQIFVLSSQDGRRTYPTIGRLLCSAHHSRVS